MGGVGVVVSTGWIERCSKKCKDVSVPHKPKDCFGLCVVVLYPSSI